MGAGAAARAPSAARVACRAGSQQRRHAALQGAAGGGRRAQWLLRPPLSINVARAPRPLASCESVFDVACNPASTEHKRVLTCAANLMLKLEAGWCVYASGGSSPSAAAGVACIPGRSAGQRSAPRFCRGRAGGRAGSGWGQLQRPGQAGSRPWRPPSLLPLPPRSALGLQWHRGGGVACPEPASAPGARAGRALSRPQCAAARSSAAPCLPRPPPARHPLWTRVAAPAGARSMRCRAPWRSGGRVAEGAWQRGRRRVPGGLVAGERRPLLGAPRNKTNSNSFKG